MNCEQFLFTRSVLFVSHLSKHKHRWPGDCLCKYFAILTTMGRCEFCLFADKLCIWSFAFFHLLLATCYLLAASGWWLATHLASPVGAPPPSAPISNVWPTIKANQPASQPAGELLAELPCNSFLCFGFCSCFAFGCAAHCSHSAYFV